MSEHDPISCPVCGRVGLVDSQKEMPEGWIGRLEGGPGPDLVAYCSERCVRKRDWRCKTRWGKVRHVLAYFLYPIYLPMIAAALVSKACGWHYCPECQPGIRGWWQAITSPFRIVSRARAAEWLKSQGMPEERTRKYGIAHEWVGYDHPLRPIEPVYGKGPYTDDLVLSVDRNERMALDHAIAHLNHLCARMCRVLAYQQFSQRFPSIKVEVSKGETCWDYLYEADVDEVPRSKSVPVIRHIFGLPGDWDPGPAPFYRPRRQ